MAASGNLSKVFAMSYFIGHKSAFEYWRSHPFSGVVTCDDVPTAGESSRAANDPTILRNQQNIYSLPVDIIVSRPQDRRTSLTTKPHVWKAIPEGSFVKARNGLFISTPDACFLQLARELPLLELIKIGFEITGSYALNAQSDNGFISLRPRTNPTSIKRYLNRCAPCKGKARAEVALGHVLEGSASPMESALAMLLCLPSSLGGFGLPTPNLNQKVCAGESNAFTAGRPTPWRKRAFYLDLYWPEKHLALEYDSDQFHLNPAKIHTDSERRMTLEREGIRVLSVTSKQVYDRTSFNTLVGVVCDYLEIDPHITRNDFEQRQQNLRRVLFETQA